MLIAYLAIMGTLGAGVISPGPSFIMIARTAAVKSRADGLAAALGMGAGGFFFACLSLFGLRILLDAAPSLYMVMKILGAIYLLYIAFSMWRGAKSPLQIEGGSLAASRNLHKSFLLGFATQISNPKTIVFYASAFSAFLPAHVPLWGAALLPCSTFAMETTWYSLVAVILSSAALSRRYVNFKKYIDRTAACFMSILAIKLLVESA